MYRRIANRVRRLFAGTNAPVVPDKYAGETDFWAQHLLDCVRWYRGDLPVLFGTPAPTAPQRVHGSNEVESALLTYLALHQEVKYLEDLLLPATAFAGDRLLDIGAGPFPSARAFTGADLYCVDPLLDRYRAVGYPTDIYRSVHFVKTRAEQMPFDDHYFDAVISVNAIDHVDDFHQVAQEVRRVLRPSGKLRMHVHYHARTVCEPIELNDSVFLAAYGWCPGLVKIHESRQKHGYVVPEDESYVVWTNFEPA